jgi:DNA-binding MarR family transcriptional regulator
MYINANALKIKFDAYASSCYPLRMADNDTLSEETVRAWARLMRVSQALFSAVEADVKAAGFPPLAWYDALLELRRAGDSGLRPFELQREMLLAQYSMSRLTDRLATAGYVERAPAPDDRRGQILRLTASGRKLLEDMWPAYRAALARHFAGRLAPKEAADLSGLLGKLL